MKVSARNVFPGKVSHLAPGNVNAEVTLVTTGGDQLVAVVTMASLRSLGLQVGSDVVALVKAPWVMLCTTDAGLTFSARNQLVGQVSTLQRGAINTEVGLTLQGGTQVFAVVTNDAVDDMNLRVGSPSCAIIKASHVILAVPA
jgi:molybdate transport system regulatory protein